jgi:hypothetical protein
VNPRALIYYRVTAAEAAESPDDLNGVVGRQYLACVREVIRLGASMVDFEGDVDLTPVDTDRSGLARLFQGLESPAEQIDLVVVTGLNRLGTTASERDGAVRRIAAAGARVHVVAPATARRAA